MDTQIVGVDGCRAGWIAADYNPKRKQITFSTHADFSALLAEFSETAVIAVDIPIGLTELFQPRRCDERARRLIGPRSSSVFPAPDRRLLRFSVYSEASAFSRGIVAKGVTRQSFAIYNKIAQVDSIMTSGLQSRVFEIHPELCFWAASGGHHLGNPKRKVAGFEERREILTRVFIGVDIPTRREAARLLPDVQPDDVLDATVAAWSALRYANGVCARVPEAPELDARGLRMEMVF
jgi:predicted RNase H-like nuclease